MPRSNAEALPSYLADEEFMERLKQADQRENLCSGRVGDVKCRLVKKHDGRHWGISRTGAGISWGKQ